MNLIIEYLRELCKLVDSRERLYRALGRRDSRRVNYWRRTLIRHLNKADKLFLKVDKKRLHKVHKELNEALSRVKVARQ